MKRFPTKTIWEISRIVELLSKVSKHLSKSATASIISLKKIRIDPVNSGEIILGEIVLHGLIVLGEIVLGEIVLGEIVLG